MIVVDREDCHTVSWIAQEMYLLGCTSICERPALILASLYGCLGFGAENSELCDSSSTDFDCRETVEDMQAQLDQLEGRVVQLHDRVIGFDTSD